MGVKKEKGDMNLIDYIMTYHQWIFVIWIVPISVLYDCFWFIRTRLSYTLTNTKGSHEERVKDVQAQVREWRASGAKTPMCTARWAKAGFQF